MGRLTELPELFIADSRLTGPIPPELGNLKVLFLGETQLTGPHTGRVGKPSHETDENVFAGSREDELRRTGEGWKIARRTIVLDSNVILAKNLSVFF